jgi:hypothetical protein
LEKLLYIPNFLSLTSIPSHTWGDGGYGSFTLCPTIFLLMKMKKMKKTIEVE